MFSLIKYYTLRSIKVDKSKTFYFEKCILICLTKNFLQSRASNVSPEISEITGNPLCNSIDNMPISNQ